MQLNLTDESADTILQVAYVQTYERIKLTHWDFITVKSIISKDPDPIDWISLNYLVNPFYLSAKG